MAQHDYDIANQSFPSFRSDLNSVLEAINTSNSGTSRPSSAVAGTIWLDTTSASTPTLKFYDGSDDISLATLDYTANTVNWLDSTVSVDIVGDTTPQLGGNLDVNGNSIVSVANGNITITPDGTGKLVVSGLSYPTADGTANQVLKTDGSGNLSFTDVSGGTSWQSVKTSAFTAVAGEGYFCNTTSSAFTVTLPAGNIGDTIELVDYAGTFATNNLTITPDGTEKIEGNTGSRLLGTNRQGIKLVYIDSTTGWCIPTANREETNPFYVAPYDIEFLVVAGGGTGGVSGGGGGGGGAGGYRTSTQSSISAGETITVTVGAGGAVPANENGSDSSVASGGITDITSAGGGYGGANAGQNGNSGGSGGGAADPGSYGSGNVPSVSPSQGNRGGSSSGGSGWNGGGGGGASQVGGDASGQSGGTGGDGGDGSSNSITGTAVYYAGGGGGAAHNGTPGTGGLGGGGDGGTAPNSPAATSGTANTGGGGGARASGGSGVVILKVPTASYSGTTTGSPTVTTSGTDTIIKFTGSGTYVT